MWGAPEDHDNGTDAGAAYVFRLDPDSKEWVEEEEEYLPSFIGALESQLSTIPRDDGRTYAIRDNLVKGVILYLGVLTTTNDKGDRRSAFHRAVNMINHDLACYYGRRPDYIAHTIKACERAVAGLPSDRLGQ